MNEIIPYHEMCRRENTSLQQGMNFNLGRIYSVILMSVRPNSPYRDEFGADNATVIYEGHDQPRSRETPNPKALDQVARTPSGQLTQNGRFWTAARAFQNAEAPAHRVRIYEKIRVGIWSYNGLFELIDARLEEAGGRKVFKFKLVAIQDDGSVNPDWEAVENHRRLIPTAVKLEVWKRDEGRCVKCGATDELHFDHDLPFSKGGTSLKAENVQLLCARHNLSKGAKLL